MRKLLDTQILISGKTVFSSKEGSSENHSGSVAPEMKMNMLKIQKKNEVPHLADSPPHSKLVSSQNLPEEQHQFCRQE